ncbi:MAG: 16S rRNA (cytidine(1402)-2'-O)-methyltransferase, partial [Burkholderiales bacterium]
MHRESAEAKESTLYVVATPIGNLRDITLRALDILKSVDVVAAEDTRVASRLLAHYGIRTRVISLRAHNERRAASSIVSVLAEGGSVALVTDAGTPVVSDPGALAVAQVREAGYAVVPVPGPSALTAAMSVSGESAPVVTFCGFLPAKRGERRAALIEMMLKSELLVFFEAPHRVYDTVTDMAEIFGTLRRITLARELTKIFEEVHVCTLGE